MLPLFFLALAQAVTPELRQHVEAGLRAKAAGDLDGAAREFQRVAELAPELAAAHVNLGSVYFQQKDYARATGPLRRALQLNADLPGAQQMLGTALLAQGAAVEAIPHLERAQAADLLGIALLEAGRTRDAVDKLEAALLQRPEDPDLTYYLSHAHGRLSKDLFERLRAQPDGATRVQQMLGEAAAGAGQREQAEKHFRAALAARADLRGVHLAIGQLYLAGGDYARAEPEFRAEARMAPMSAMAAYKLGLTLMNLGKAAEAITELQRAEQLQPGMPETHLALGKALAATGDLSGAEGALQKVVQAEPASALAEAAHLQLSQIYRKLGRTADADREIRALQELRRGRR
jgi:tetratricopeptide (TPR) repeat protein